MQASGGGSTDLGSTDLSSTALEGADRFADEELPPQPRLSGDRDWSFLWSPGWVLSHLFALTVIVSMVGLGFWQLDRLADRRATNEAIESRSFGDAVSIAEAIDAPAGERDFVSIADSGRYLESEFVRVANRSQGGAAGDWVVGVFETDQGQTVLVNRGFLGRDELAAPGVDGPIIGWVRESQVKDSSFGGTDSGDTFRIPRLDVGAIEERLIAQGLVAEDPAAEDPAAEDPASGGIAPMWVQLAEPERDFAAPLAAAGELPMPEPVPLPPLDEGSHFSYALQWFTFSAMGAFVYALILRRRAGERRGEHGSVTA